MVHSAFESLSRESALACGDGLRPRNAGRATSKAQSRRELTQCSVVTPQEGSRLVLGGSLPFHGEICRKFLLTGAVVGKTS